MALGTRNRPLSAPDRDTVDLKRLNSPGVKQATYLRWAGSSTASFVAYQSFATGTSPHFVDVADLNGGGKPDLIVTNSHDDVDNSPALPL